MDVFLFRHQLLIRKLHKGKWLNAAILIRWTVPSMFFQNHVHNLRWAICLWLVTHCDIPLYCSSFHYPFLQLGTNVAVRVFYKTICRTWSIRLLTKITSARYSAMSVPVNCEKMRDSWNPVSMCPHRMKFALSFRRTNHNLCSRQSPLCTSTSSASWALSFIALKSVLCYHCITHRYIYLHPEHFAFNYIWYLRQGSSKSKQRTNFRIMRSS